MIPIQLQPEPTDFFAKVQQPGEIFLAKDPDPTTSQWNKHNYWKRVLDDLYAAYSGICAYSCHWISPDTGGKTVEHFKPKKKYPQYAYRWENYRLVCGVLNGRKGEHEDVLDPFAIQEGWFVIDFSTLLVRPGPDISTPDARLVESTINRLGLNDEATCLRTRTKWLLDYIEVPFPFSYLARNAPFLASELKRQNLVETIHEIIRY